MCCFKSFNDLKRNRTGIVNFFFVESSDSCVVIKCLCCLVICNRFKNICKKCTNELHTLGGSSEHCPLCLARWAALATALEEQLEFKV